MMVFYEIPTVVNVGCFKFPEGIQLRHIKRRVDFPSYETMISVVNRLAMDMFVQIKFHFSVLFSGHVFLVS